MEAYKGREFKGLVSYVAPAVDESSGRVEVHAQLGNPDHALAPGMFANVKQIFSKGIKHLLVPQNSVIANNEERFVWVLQGDKVSKRLCHLGATPMTVMSSSSRGCKTQILWCEQACRTCKREVKSES